LHLIPPLKCVASYLLNRERGDQLPGLSQPTVLMVEAFCRLGVSRATDHSEGCLYRMVSPSPILSVGATPEEVSRVRQPRRGRRCGRPCRPRPPPPPRAPRRLRRQKCEHCHVTVFMVQTTNLVQTLSKSFGSRPWLGYAFAQSQASTRPLIIFSDTRDLACLAVRSLFCF